MFENLLKGFLSDLKKQLKTKVFGQRNYVCRKEQWTFAYRTGSEIDTNMFVEAFHRVLKYIYLQGSVKRRMDKLVFTLLKYARDKGFDRLIKLTKGKAGV